MDEIDEDTLVKSLLLCGRYHEMDNRQLTRDLIALAEYPPTDPRFWLLMEAAYRLSPEQYQEIVDGASEEAVSRGQTPD